MEEGAGRQHAYHDPEVTGAYQNLDLPISLYARFSSRSHMDTRLLKGIFQCKPALLQGLHDSLGARTNLHFGKDGTEVGLNRART